MTRGSKRQQCLRFLERPPSTVNKPSKSDRPLNYRPLRRTTYDLQRLIVVLRYGSLVVFTRQLNSISTIGAHLNIAKSTVGKVLKRHEINGYSIVIKKSPGRKPLIYPKWLSTFLLSYSCLTMWAHLSLYRRVHQLKTEYNYSTSVSSLARFYKKNHIRWIRPAFVYRQYVDRAPTL